MDEELDGLIEAKFKKLSEARAKAGRLIGYIIKNGSMPYSRDALELGLANAQESLLEAQYWLLMAKKKPGSYSEQKILEWKAREEEVIKELERYDTGDAPKC